MDDLLKPMVDRAGVIAMQRGLFTLDAPDEFMRFLSQEDYYRVRSWLRYVRRQMIEAAKE